MTMINRVQQVVAQTYGITVQKLLSHDRHKTVSEARMAAVALARRITRSSYPELGRAFGNRDHTTMISAVVKAGSKCRESREFQMRMNQMESDIRSEDPILSRLLDEIQQAEQDVLDQAKEWLRCRGKIRAIEFQAEEKLRISIGKLIQLEKGKDR